MARLRTLAFALLTLGVLTASSPARAEVVEDDGVVITAVVLGTLGGLTTSVGAIVYAVDHRAFTTPWVVASFFSVAVTGAMTTAIIVDGAQNQNPGALFGAIFYAAITFWPGYWAVRTALSEVEPGEHETPEVAPRMALDPFAKPERRAGPRPIATLSFAF